MLRASAASLDEHLHADVMRFLAIIAFCLIAIFALVRNSEAPRPAPEVLPPEPEPAAAATPPPPAPAQTKHRRPAPQPMPVAELRPVPAPQPAPAAQPLTPRLIAKPAAASAPPRGDPEPLALKFTSDAAFLRLLSSGRARLFAGADSTWMTLRRGVRWQSTDAPRRYHELLLATLPEVVVSAFPGDPTAVQWGVSLPASTEHAISRLAARHETGRLLIDRDGSVRFSP